jgi:hypothetical protein
MSRIKVSRAPQNKRPSKRQGWPVVVYLWTFGQAIISYTAARVIFDGKPHPYHWLTALVGGAAGIPLGWLWYRWRGDVI